MEAMRSLHRPFSGAPASLPATLAWLLGLAWLGVSCSPEASKREPASPPSYAVSTQDFQAATLRGKAIAAQGFALLSTNLLLAIEQHGVSNALPFCSAQALPLTSLVARTNGVELRRVSHKARNPANQANEAEQALILRLQTGGSTEARPQPMVVGTAPDTVTFYAPIVISDALCLKCHGQPEEDIALDDLVTIRRLYPSDAATGFKLGDLRGLWRVDFKRSALAPEP
jgi:hypothetical protein